MPARPGPTWGCKKPGESAASSFIPRVQTSFLPAPSAALLAHSRSEVYFAPSTAASIGSACCSLEKTWAVLGSPWIHTTRTRYLQACGKWKCTLGVNSVVDPVVESTCLTTVEPNGLASRSTVYRMHQSARLTSPSLPQTPGVSLH